MRWLPVAVSGLHYRPVCYAELLMYTLLAHNCTDFVTIAGLFTVGFADIATAADLLAVPRDPFLRWTLHYPVNYPANWFLFNVGCVVYNNSSVDRLCLDAVLFAGCVVCLYV